MKLTRQLLKSQSLDFTNSREDLIEVELFKGYDIKNQQIDENDFFFIFQTVKSQPFCHRF